MRIRVDASDFRLGQRLGRYVDSRRAAIARAVADGAFLVHEHAVDAMSEQKSGELYTTEFRTGANGRVFPIGVERVPHRASAPGEAPAVDTGRLKSSLHVNTDPGTLSADVIAPVGYALHLEYGTRNMAPRPFLGPALEAHRQTIEGDIRAALLGRQT